MLGLRHSILAMGGTCILWVPFTTCFLLSFFAWSGTEETALPAKKIPPLSEMKESGKNAG